MNPAGKFDKMVKVFAKTDAYDSVMQRFGYSEIGMDWAEIEFLETIKDNETETARSHDSAFAIARLIFRDQPLFVEHLSTHQYEVDGVRYEAVGQPIRRNGSLVYVNIKNRDDL